MYLSYGQRLLQDVTKWIKLNAECLSVNFTFLHSLVKCCLLCSERCMFTWKWERCLLMIVVNPVSVHLSLHFIMCMKHNLSWKLQAPMHDELKGVFRFGAWVALLKHTNSALKLGLAQLAHCQRVWFTRALIMVWLGQNMLEIQYSTRVSPSWFILMGEKIFTVEI
jgi:hypothetical protein